jgi:hypothetical protein
MTPRPSRIATAALALLVVVGLERCTTHNCMLVSATLKAVTIDQAAHASPDTVYVSLSHFDTLAWVPYTNRPLTITFHHELYPAVTRGEPPFAGGTNGADQVFSSTGTLYSGAINPNLKALFDQNPSLQLNYKYDQTIDGVTVDGRIIIMK